MRELLYLKNVVTLHLNKELCVGCGMCISVCPHEVFSLEDGHAVIKTRDACMECGACAINCPEAAVTVKAGVGCAAAVINAALGVKDSSCCCTLDPENNSCCNGESGNSRPRCC